MVFEEKIELGGRTLSLETGRLAKQADGAVLVRYGDTMVLVTTCITAEPREGMDFLPLLVEYREKYYAAGKIPGGFFKREGRPSEKEILTSRLIDRPVRSLFPKSFRRDVQIIANVLSSDQENDSDLLAMIGAYLFVLSDSVLAIERFRGTGRIARILVLGTYFAAQWLIALSI